MSNRTRKDQREPSSHKALQPLRPRVFWTVVKTSGLMPMTCGFIVMFVLCTVVVKLVEPGVEHYGDAAWFLFTVVTTIGLGDFSCVTFLGRLATVVLSFYSLFFFALITGAVVSYCNEIMTLRTNESVAEFVYQLEHLPELSHDELEELSEKVRRLV